MKMIFRWFKSGDFQRTVGQVTSDTDTASLSVGLLQKQRGLTFLAEVIKGENSFPLFCLICKQWRGENK